MTIVMPEYIADTEALIETARIDDPDDRERFLELIQAAESRPGAAAYERRVVEALDGDDVIIGSVTFRARPLSRLFTTGEVVYPYVATCGLKMAEFGGALTDELEKYWWDIIMLDAVGKARIALRDEIGRIAGYEPVSVNPGSIEMWPVSNQPALFSLIGDVGSSIGVTIAPSFLMIPLKSVSGIFFRGSGGEGSFTHNCSLCERENCPNRAAPFDANLKAMLS